MNWIPLLIGVLTFILVVNCLLLMLLVLIQLPKKEAGIGTAFGGAATDALFGAGSGTALTKMTKYCTGIFLVVALALSVLHTHRARASGRALSPEEIARRVRAAATKPAPGGATNWLQGLTFPSTNNPPASATNAPSNLVSTNTPAAAVIVTQAPAPSATAPAAPEKK